MNIFFVDRNPRAAAGALCDKHLRKMLLETAQIICTVHHNAGTVAQLIPYRRTHHNHPCVVWAGSSVEAFTWVADLGMWMCLEYAFRFGKHHASEEVIKKMTVRMPLLPIMGWLHEPPQCMPPEFRGDDTVLAYRRYYAIGKRDVCSGYTNAAMPGWLQELRAINEEACS